MKLQFKVQQYQTEAVDAVVEVFAGQPYADGVKYRIDPGKCLHPDVTGAPKQIYSFAEAVDADNRTIKIKDKPLNWGGAVPLCTRDSKFEVNEQGDCATRGLTALGFTTVDMTSGGKTLRFAMP